MAYTVYLGEKQELRLRQPATQSDVQILPPDRGNFVGLKFSPDGSYIYFVRSDKNDISFRYLYSIPSLGGSPRRLITDVDSNIGFSPDGRRIAYTHGVPALNQAELKIANADGTGERVLAVIHNTSLFYPGRPRTGLVAERGDDCPGHAGLCRFFRFDIDEGRSSVEFSDGGGTLL